MNVREIREKLADIISLARERRGEAKDTVPDLDTYRLDAINRDLDDIADKLVELFE
jgi:hypothetical protein